MLPQSERFFPLDESIVYFNGEFCKAAEAKMSVFDHGLLYGDGIFDTCGVVNGNIFKLERHIDRFFKSARYLNIEIPLSKTELKEAVVETVKRNNLLQRAFLKFICTRGAGEPFINPKFCEKPTLIVMARPLMQTMDPVAREKGQRAMTSSIRRIPPGCGVEPRAKHLNYMNSLMMYLEIQNAGIDEVISLDVNGFVAEAATMNLFMVTDGVFYTPPTYNILEGITRETVIDIVKKAGHKVELKLMTIFDLYCADEIFTTATGAAGGGIIPLVELDGRKIGDGEVGPLTKWVKETYIKMLLDGVDSTPVV
jgi:branched-chain amino acid aminotransferase